MILIVAIFVFSYNVIPFLDPCGEMGGVLLGSQCLLFNSAKQTWDGAVSACSNSGHQLASIVDLQGLVDYLDRITHNKDKNDA